MISIETTVTGQKGELLQRLARELGPAGRAKPNEAATHPVAVLIRGHILTASQTRHTTADNIRHGPAKRTDHLKKAAESVSESVTSEEGQVGISSPGFRRALGPLQIRVRHKRFLTIPIHAKAYGETVATLRGQGVEVFRPKGKTYLAANLDGVFRVLYLLRTEVTLKHDPGLLPEVDEIGEAAKTGVESLVLRILGGAA